jgi:hypothetical protein
MLCRDKLLPLITWDTLGLSALAMGGLLLIAGHASTLRSGTRPVDSTTEDPDQAADNLNPIRRLFGKSVSQQPKSLVAFKLLNDEHLFKATVQALQTELIRPYKTKAGRDEALLSAETLDLVRNELEKECEAADAQLEKGKAAQLQTVKDRLLKGHSMRRILQEIQPRVFVVAFDPTDRKQRLRDPVRDLIGACHLQVSYPTHALESRVCLRRPFGVCMVLPGIVNFLLATTSPFDEVVVKITSPGLTRPAFIDVSSDRC